MFNLEYIRRAERFYALSTPIYYYVRTKGSLATQGFSVTKTIQMKLTVFEYYQKFYKTVLSEEEYEKSRLKVYKFLLDAAGDGKVPLIVGARRLGEERPSIPFDLLAGEGMLFNAFRERKLIERYLEPAVLKHSLTLSEVCVLLYLHQMGGSASRPELSEFTGLSRGSLTIPLKKLTTRGLAKAEDSPDGPPSGRKRIVLTSASRPVLDDLLSAQEQYVAARLSGLTETERSQYEETVGRIQENIRNILS